MELEAEGVLVELDDVGRGDDVVLFEEDVFGLAGVRAVGFGEDDDWGGGVSCGLGADNGKGKGDVLGLFFKMELSSVSASW